MNVLGIFAIGMNPAACLISDGKLIAFVEEERFTRLKTSKGMFPSRAVAYCMSKAKLSLNDIDSIAFGWDAHKYPWKMLKNYMGNYITYKGSEGRAFHKERGKSINSTVIQDLLEYQPARIESDILKGLRAAGLNGKIPKIEFVPHHLAHAYSSFFCSGFDKAGILTIDGHGEEICTQLAIGDGNDIRVVESFPIPHSLGWFYASITEYLGLIPYRDEGKLMGLAAYGEKRKASNKWLEPFSRIVSITDRDYKVDPTYTLLGGHYYGQHYTDHMVHKFTSIDKNATPIAYGEKININGQVKSKYLLDTYVDMAWAAQEILEQAAVMLARKLVKDHGVDNICIAGGVGLNCKMNGEILRQSGCLNIFAQPASSDAGTALGAAIYIANRNGDSIKNTIKLPYTGPEFTNDAIRNALNNCKLKYREVSDPSLTAAQLLNEGKILAWFQGGMECGARALGNRSILANPIFPEMKDKVNNQVKYRESWRPFCPSLIDDVKDKYIEEVNEASYMIVAYHMKEKMQKELPALVHVDGTIRPQVVTKENNALFHSLIEQVGKETGHPILLNTSFNVRGEPIVCSPHEAVRCFYSNGIDALVIGNFVVEK